MKLKQWLYGAAALAMLAGCSDKDVAPGGGENGGGSGEAVSGYMAIQIKLPTETTTRAESVENDGVEFKDGLPEEYAVENAMVLLFKGKSTGDDAGEMKAKLYRAQKLEKPFFDSQPADDQITSSYLAAIPVSVERNSDDFIWALVILNNNELTTGIAAGTTEEDPDEDETVIAKIAGQNFTTSNTFRDVLLQITTNPFISKGKDDKNKFFMTNAPMSTVIGGYNATGLPSDNSKIQYMTPLGNQVYETPDKAKANVSGCVYVERAVAKVTYQNNSLANDAIQLQFVDETGTAIPMKNGETKNFDITATVQYALTNTNKKSFMVRNVEFGTDEKGNTLAEGTNHFSWGLTTMASDGLNYARLVGSTPMPVLGAPFTNASEANHQAIFRTYWCKDPNYSLQMGDDKNTTPTFSDLDKPLYCKENTFTVNNQNHGNSTLAVFKIDYTIYDKRDGTKAINDLYIKDGDYSKIYISKEAVANNEITRIVNDTKILDAMKKSLKTGHSTAEYDVLDHLNIDIKRKSDSSPILLVKSISLNVPADDAWFDDASVATFAAEIGEANDPNSYQYKLLENINALSDIEEFKGAVSYHVIPIMHFGDFYTPWNTEFDAGVKGSIKGTETKDVYNGGSSWAANDDHARKYLGRYGMVRNNWYELNISKITSLGSPTLPEIKDNLSDDNNEQKKYFAIEIHILSWAKRTQNVPF